MVARDLTLSLSRMARRPGAAAAATARGGSDEPVVRGRSGLDLKLWLSPAVTIFSLIALNALAGSLPVREERVSKPNGRRASGAETNEAPGEGGEGNEEKGASFSTAAFCTSGFFVLDALRVYGLSRLRFLVACVFACLLACGRFGCLCLPLCVSLFVPFLQGGTFVLQVISGLFLAVAAGVLVPVFAFVISLPPVHDRTVAFFHPFADGGGGGERVLWEAVRALQRSRPDLQVAIYCGDGPVPESTRVAAEGSRSAPSLPSRRIATEAYLRGEAKRRFGIVIKAPLVVVPLKMRERLLPERYRFATAARQALGSVRLTAQALARLRPATFVDTTGWAFGYPLARLAGCRVVAYVHYPTVSADMVARVRSREAGFNNAGFAVTSLGSSLKVLYYGAMRHWYGRSGRCASVVLANSTWTATRVRDAWWLPDSAVVKLYPPADVATLEQAAAEREETGAVKAAEAEGAARGVGATDAQGTARSLGFKASPPLCVYVAQFRPEKGHEMLVRAIAMLREWAHEAQRRAGVPAGDDEETTATPSDVPPPASAPLPTDLPVPLSPARILSARFVFVGGCRDEADAARADGLEALARELSLPPATLAIERNVSSDRLRSLLLSASLGLHAMRDEHFGIGVVEGCAAGAVAVANDSGGPREDIVVPASDDWWRRHAKGNDARRDEKGGSDPPTGMLCSDAPSYARALAIALSAPRDDLAALAANGQERVKRFDAAAFRAGFLEAVAPALPAKLP